LIVIGLLLLSIGIALAFQWTQGYWHPEWGLYGALFYYLGLPLVLVSIGLLFLQNLVVNKMLALGLSALALLLFNSKLALGLGLSHPLWRFANTPGIPYFDMNGFGLYQVAFHWQMVQEGAMGLTMLLLSLLLWNRNQEESLRRRLKNRHPALAFKVLLAGSALLLLASSGYIYVHTHTDPQRLTDQEKFDWKQSYEQKYKAYESMDLPVIVQVRTAIDLFPSRHCYRVKGGYTVVNKTKARIDSLLVYSDPDIQLTALRIDEGQLLEADKVFHHARYRLRRPLLPQDTLTIHFRFESVWPALQEHHPVNAVLDNGSFLRISRYFPRLGYQVDNEISNVAERERRHLQPQPPLRQADAAAVDPYAFIGLDALVSTDGDQTALGSGELLGQWEQNGRRYFHYKTDRPIPFRFALASARYKVRRAAYKNIGIEVYYDARHPHNVNRLLRHARATLAYGEAQFGPYPHRSIRFAEISAFATGFAATAYPSIIYVKEDQGFHADLRRADEQDVMNQLAGHELAHLWWGSAQLNPDIRQGYNMLTETLAQYTEIMMYRKAHGWKPTLGLIKVHLDQYLSGRGYQAEMPLYQVDFESPHIAYNKGLVVMHQLEQLIGEANVNKALSMLLKRHSYPHTPARSLDLIHLFYQVSPASAHAQIDELFKKIITYDAKVETASVKRVAGNRYLVDFRARVQKFSATPAGKKTLVAGDAGLEVGIETAGGNMKVSTFGVAKGQVRGQVLLGSRPTRIVLDPNLKNLESSPQDNEQDLLP
jgi:hypothetical protein